MGESERDAVGVKMNCWEMMGGEREIREMLHLPHYHQYTYIENIDVIL